MSTLRSLAMIPLLTAALPLLWGGAQAQGDSFRIGYTANSSHQAPLRVSFQATFPAGNQVEWDFGDNTRATGAAVNHVYARPGTYPMQATLTDSLGRVVSRAASSIEVRSAGAERAELTILQTPGEVRLSSEGSVLYSASPVRLFLDGRPVSSAPQRVTPGQHVALAQASTSDGRTVNRQLTFTVAPWTGSDAFNSEVLRLTNRARAQGWNCVTKSLGGPRMPPLRADRTLDIAAQAQSAAMALYGYFDHTSTFDGSTPMRRVQATGLSLSAVAENIAAGQGSPAEVVDAWLRSPGHCHNIMGNFTMIGLSYVNRPGTLYTKYWTQVFAQP